MWGRGRVSLLGDAAHLSTPILSQGTAQAFEDALALGRAIGEGIYWQQRERSLAVACQCGSLQGGRALCVRAL